MQERWKPLHEHEDRQREESPRGEQDVQLHHRFDAHVAQTLSEHAVPQHWW